MSFGKILRFCAFAKALKFYDAKVTYVEILRYKKIINVICGKNI